MNTERNLLSKAIRDVLRRGTLIASLFAAALASSGIHAQDSDDEGDGVDTEQLLEDQTVIKSEIEIGVGNVSDSSWRFGRYTGLEDDGLFPVVNIDIYKRGGPWDGDNASYWRLTGRNLGIESRDLMFEFGKQGSYNFHLGFDEIPHYQLQDSQTFFAGAGSSNLTLPSNWVGGQTTAQMSQLGPNLRTYGIEHGRQRANIGGDVTLPSGWSFKADYSREKKDGNKVTALTIGNSGGNPRAVLAPEPVDYLTQQLDAVLSFADATKQFSIGYYMSLFDNDNTGLIWQNPYSAISGWDSSAGFPGGQGQVGLEPDNEFHQLNLKGGYSFSKTLRLVGDVSIGRATQNDAFLPYTINPVLAATITQPLPEASLDGEVDVTHVGLRLTGQPWDTVSLGASFKYDERDNKTHHQEFVYIGGDSNAQNVAPNSGVRRFNEPKSYKDERFRLDAGWRASDWLRIDGEAEFRKTERPHQERERIDEDRFSLNFAIDTGGFWTGGLRLNNAKRDGGSEYLGYETLLGGYSPDYYNTLQPFVGGFPFENLPGLRKFNQADRKRQNGELYASFMPADAVSISASYNYSEDDYNNSELGLTFSRVRTLNVDVTWTPTNRFSVYAFAAEDRYDNDQDGRQYSGGGVRPTQYNDPNRNWTMKSRDYVLTYGVGGNLSFLEDRIKVGFDLVNSRADSDIFVTTGPSLTSAPLPTSESDLNSASLWADYRWRKDINFRLRFAYEDYAESDWAVDGVPPNQLANVITLGESSPDYSVWVTTFSVAYRF
ncbi:MAG: MtrB/PioB family decaheme-associated outer membrane protein [Rhodanobacteraceae bacterium]|nr:MtrB/PioB family decaheme-associated outer membrane protein [Rhodanobacteraceae bacterium]